MAYSVAGASALLLLLHAAGVRLPPVVAAWQLIPPEELFELHEIFVLPTGADAGMDAVQHAMLAYSGYDWRALENGWLALQDCLVRHHRRHPNPNAALCANAATLFRRQRPWHGHDVDVAASVQQTLAGGGRGLAGERLVIAFFGEGYSFSISTFLGGENLQTCWPLRIGAMAREDRDAETCFPECRAHTDMVQVSTSFSSSSTTPGVTPATPQRSVPSIPVSCFHIF